MKITAGMKYVALGAAVGLLGFAGAAFAQASNQNYQLVGASARLDRTINTETVKPGQPVTARLEGAVTTSDGAKLEKGTELLGTVAEVKPSSNRSAASLTLLFTSAQIKEGKQIPVKVTLLAAYPISEADDATYGAGLVAPLPKHVDSQATLDQEPGLLNSVALKSAVQEADSGTFSRADGNFRLVAGTYFQLGIAAANGSSASAGE
jgi:hypothetical protein